MQLGRWGEAQGAPLQLGRNPPLAYLSDSHSSSQKKYHVNTSSRSDSVCQDISILTMLLAARQTSLVIGTFLTWGTYHAEKKEIAPSHSKLH